MSFNVSNFCSHQTNDILLFSGWLYYYFASESTKAEAFFVHEIKKELCYFESLQGMHNTIFHLA